jgi:hypothetical protein
VVDIMLEKRAMAVVKVDQMEKEQILLTSNSI